MTASRSGGVKSISRLTSGPFSRWCPRKPTSWAKMPALTSSTMLSCAAAGRGAVTSHAIDSELSTNRVRDRWEFREWRIRIEPFLSPIALVNASRIHLTVIVPACQWPRADNTAAERDHRVDVPGVQPTPEWRGLCNGSAGLEQTGWSRCGGWFSGPIFTRDLSCDESTALRVGSMLF